MRLFLILLFTSLLPAMKWHKLTYEVNYKISYRFDGLTKEEGFSVDWIEIDYLEGVNDGP